MEQNENSESPRPSHAPSGRNRWEEWDGQDSSLPEEPYEPEDDGLPSPHVRPGEKTRVEAGQERRAAGEAPQHSLPGEPSPQPAPGDGLPPEVAEARRRQGLTGPPRRTGTGFFYKNGDEIPPTHPDHGPMHLLPRQEDGSFAAYYYCSKQELADFGGSEGPPPRRCRRDGWTAERQDRFVEALAASSSWTQACRAVDMSRTAAYNLYNRSPAFRAACDEALKSVKFVLATTAFDRAVEGYEEIVYHQGQRVGVRWKYDNKLLMQLLRARDPLNYAPLSELQGWLRQRGLEPEPRLEAARDSLAAAEHEWGRRLPGEDLLARPAAIGQASSTALAAKADDARQVGRAAAPAAPALPGPGVNFANFAPASTRFRVNFANFDRQRTWLRVNFGNLTGGGGPS